MKSTTDRTRELIERLKDKYSDKYEYDWQRKVYDRHDNDIEEKQRSELKRKIEEFVKKMREQESLRNITMDDVHKKFTTKELLDSIDIDEIDTYVRTKKLQRIQKNIQK